jgi:hypothetical protein
MTMVRFPAGAGEFFSIAFRQALVPHLASYPSKVAGHEDLVLWLRMVEI